MAHGLFIRLFHWSLALGIGLNYWLLEAGEEPHEWLGYGLGAIVLARLARGFFGPQNERFTHFVVGPKAFFLSLRRFPEFYHSTTHHNRYSPPAGWMVTLLLSLVLLVVISGWMQELDAFWGEDWVQLLHEYAAHALVIAAGFHISAVVLIQCYFKLPLIQSMLGKRFFKP